MMQLGSTMFHAAPRRARKAAAAARRTASQRRRRGVTGLGLYKNPSTCAFKHILNYFTRFTIATNISR